MPELTPAERFEQWDQTFRKKGVYPLFHTGLGVIIEIPNRGDVRQLAKDVLALGNAISRHAVQDLAAEANELQGEIARANAQRSGNGQGVTSPDTAVLLQAVAELRAQVASLQSGGANTDGFAEPAGPATTLPPGQRRRRAPRSDGKPPAEGEGRDYGRAVEPLNPATMGRPQTGGEFA